MMQLKKDWKEIDHASGKYWYNVKTRETTRDMPLACPPDMAIASLVAEHDGGASSFEYCKHCQSGVMATVRYTALEDGRQCRHWLQKRCCPTCDDIIGYTTVATPTTSTRALAGDKVAQKSVIGRQESFARRLARKVMSTVSSDSKCAKEANALDDAPLRKTETSAHQPAVQIEPVAEEVSTSSTRAKRISLKRARLENCSMGSTEKKSPRQSTADPDQIRMVIDVEKDGIASGQTAKFAFESEIV